MSVNPIFPPNSRPALIQANLFHYPAVPVSVLFVITFMTAGVGGSTKKVAFGVAYQLGYTIGNIIGPQTYRESDAPDYYVSHPENILMIFNADYDALNPQIAKYTMLAFLLFCIILLGSMGTLHWWWNRARDLQDKKDRESRFNRPIL